MQTFFALFPNLDANQITVYATAFVLLYCLFFVMRDIFLRTDSTVYQIFCILLAAALPIIGFLLYFLIRPARTIKQRQTDAILLSGVSQPKTSDPFRL